MASSKPSMPMTAFATVPKRPSYLNKTYTPETPIPMPPATQVAGPQDSRARCRAAQKQAKKLAKLSRQEDEERKTALTAFWQRQRGEQRRGR